MKEKFEPRATPLYVVLICGMIILIAGLYLLITKTEASPGSMPMGRYNHEHVPIGNLNGKYAIVLGSVISILAIYYIIKQKK